MLFVVAFGRGRGFTLFFPSSMYSIYHPAFCSCILHRDMHTGVSKFSGASVQFGSFHFYGAFHLYESCLYLWASSPVARRNLLSLVSSYNMVN